jgi:hypothetical protein
MLYSIKKSFLLNIERNKGMDTSFVPRKIPPLRPFILIGTLFGFLFGLFNATHLTAQTSVVFINPASGPSTSGPTTANQVVTFFTNAGVPYAPTVTATFSLSNQQFSYGQWVLQLGVKIDEACEKEKPSRCGVETALFKKWQIQTRECPKYLIL